MIWGKSMSNFQSFQLDEDDTGSEYSSCVVNTKEDDKSKTSRRGEDKEHLMRKEQW